MTLVNVDPTNPSNRADPRRVYDLGLGGVRLVCRTGVESYIDECHAADLFVLGIITNASEGNMLGGLCDAYQIGNEPDGTGESSDSMTRAEYVDMARLYRQTYPELVMISAGLVSGNVSWWATVGPAIIELGYQGFAVHPYNKTPRAAETLLKAYQKATPTLPCWITEWHRPAGEIPAWKAMLRRVGVVGDAWFSWGYDEWSLWPDKARALKAAA